MAEGYGALGGDAHVKVQTEVLTEKAETVRTAIANMKKSLGEITQKVGRMSAYWEGEASQQARNIYQKQQEAMEKILQDLEKYPQRLLDIAGVYDTSEKTNVSAAQGLKSNNL